MTFEKIQETAQFLLNKTSVKPTVGIILGSGLGSLADAIELESSIAYNDIPNFLTSTVEGHAGKLMFGKLGGKDVILMVGRFHYYEGYDMKSVTFPVRVMRAMGVRSLMVSNAAGGMQKGFKVGDIMLIKDHINLFPEHPLRGQNDSRLGVRFPDMTEPYSLDYINIAKQKGAELGYELKEGVYAGLSGPTFETKAEYVWLHSIGADAVGMSTVPEVIVAVHGGMKVFAASIITDLGIREEMNTITHEEVLQAANEAAPKLARLFTEVIRTIED